MSNKVRFVLTDDSSETEVIQCTNQECGMKMIIVAIFTREDIYGESSLVYMNQARMSYCPYCGKEQSSE